MLMWCSETMIMQWLLATRPGYPRTSERATMVFWISPVPSRMSKALAFLNRLSNAPRSSTPDRQATSIDSEQISMATLALMALAIETSRELSFSWSASVAAFQQSNLAASSLLLRDWTLSLTALH